jgi:hypothetical protein
MICDRNISNQSSTMDSIFSIIENYENSNKNYTLLPDLIPPPVSNSIDSTILDNFNKLTGVNRSEMRHILDSTIKYGMCFMLKVCKLDEHITCHRFKASSNMKPRKVYNHRSYYASYSTSELIYV